MRDVLACLTQVQRIVSFQLELQTQRRGFTMFAQISRATIVATIGLFLVPSLLTAAAPRSRKQQADAASALVRRVQQLPLDKQHSEREKLLDQAIEKMPSRTLKYWHQGMVKRNQPANGFWAIRILKGGRYRITLRARPRHVPYSFAGGSAQVSVNGKAVDTKFDRGAAAIHLEMNLPAGNAKLQTTIREEGKRRRGAYFVTIKRLANRGKTSQFRFRKGDRITWLGGTNVERRQTFGYLETLLASAHPDLNLKFRNLGWSGDNVHGLARAVFGQPANGYKRLITDLRATKPSVVMLEYGNNEAHAGSEGLSRFQEGLQRLVVEIKKLGARPVIWLPRDYEQFGAAQDVALGELPRAVGRLEGPAPHP